MAEMYEVIIVGAGGAMGSSACMHLAARGARVLGIDRFGIGHDRGSSHGLSRMIRMCYYEHPDYVPLLRRAYELWRTLEADCGERLLYTPGGVYLGRPDAEAVWGSRRAAVEHGLAHEILTRADLRARFPQFDVPEDFVGLFEPEAGWLVPERAIRAQAGLAMKHGATIRTDERVLEWNADGASVHVRTERGEYRARTLVICAGAWATRLMPDLGVTITPTRQALTWFTPRNPALFRENFPVWAIQATEEFGGDLFYGFPLSGEGPLGAAFKAARHARGPATDPDRTDWNACPEDERNVRPFLSRFIAAAAGDLLAVRVCMYENSPDGHFIVDRHPRHAHVFVAAGFSGHGFKFASVVGEVLADLALAGGTRHPIGFLSLARLRS